MLLDDLWPPSERTLSAMECWVNDGSPSGDIGHFRPPCGDRMEDSTGRTSAFKYCIYISWPSEWSFVCHVVSRSSWLRQASKLARSRWTSPLLIPSSAQSALLSRAIARRASTNVSWVNARPWLRQAQVGVPARIDRSGLLRRRNRGDGLVPKGEHLVGAEIVGMKH